MYLRLQKCGLKDVDLLAKISRKTFKEAFEKVNNPIDFKNYISRAFSREKLLEELAQDQTEFYFVFTGNDLVGYFKLNTDDAQTDLKTDDTLELERIYVLGNFQGMGIGRSILAEVKKIAVGKQKKILWLGVWEKNTKAIKFYESHGFLKFGTHPYYIGNDKQTDWLMRFELGEFLGSRAV